MIWLLNIGRTFVAGNSLLAMIALGAAAFASWTVWQRHLGAKSARVKIVRASEKQGARLNAKADKARARIAKPGAADDVLRRYCRDC